MGNAGKLTVAVAVLSWVAFGSGNSPAQADEVLQNTGLEASAGPSGWMLTTEIVGMPGVATNSTEHLDAANEPAPAPGELGLLIRPFAGNVGNFAGQDLAYNMSLTQTISSGVQPGRTFEFIGHSFVQGSSSVIVDTLDAITPLGDYNLNAFVDAPDYTIWRDTLGSTTDFRANGTNEGDSLDLIDQADYEYWAARFGDSGRPAGIPSPTQTFFKVEFLDAGGAVLATHMNDLRDDTTPGDPDDPQADVWRTHTLEGLVSPTGTTQARVSTVLTDGRASCSQCEFGSDLWIDNFSFKQTIPPNPGEKLTNANLNTLGPPDGWVIEKTPEDNLSFSGAAGFAANTGNVGMWLRAFNGGDAKILQTVAATPGADYDFSAFSKWEVNYRGADPIAFTETFLTMEFLDGSSAVIGTEMLDLKRGPDGNQFVLDEGQQTNDNMWREFTLNGTAPAGTASVRVSVGATGLVLETGPTLSAFFDDMSLIETLPGAGSLAAVPEPATIASLGLALVGLCGIRRRSK